METSALLVFGWAVAQTDTSIASVLASAYPLLPWAWGALVLGERLRPAQCAGAALVIGGSLLLPVDVPLPLLASGILVAGAGWTCAALWRRVRPFPLPAIPAASGPEGAD
jgi:EamA domain-containing membrane protein RarD